MKYHWEDNPNDIRYQNKQKRDLYKSYLQNLNHFENYNEWLNNNSLKDNITSIKDYFKLNIFISIYDYKNRNYNKTYSDLKSLINRINQTKTYHRKLAKNEKYSILLKKLSK